jgi:drug/metabolite transporter (DMT)-like permease
MRDVLFAIACVDATHRDRRASARFTDPAAVGEHRRRLGYNPVAMRLTPLRADGVLLLAALLWGISFVPQQLAMAHVGPLTFVGAKFGLSVLCMLPLLRLDVARGPAGAAPRWPWLMGGLAGLALALGSILQQIGVKYTTVSNAGFITGLYVILVPLLGIAMRQPARATHWVGALLALIGLYLLTVSGSMGMNTGDLLVLAAAFFWSLQILIIDRFALQVDAIRLSILQSALTAALAGGIALLTEEPSWAGILAARWSILYVGVFSGAIAFTLQIVAQRAAPAAHAAILFSLEAVFAALAGRVLLDEQLTPRQLAGCAVILGGILCSQLDRIAGHASGE